MRTAIRVLAVAAICFASAWAEAGLVTSLPGGTAQTMPAIDYQGSGPKTFGSGVTITWSSTNASNNGGAVFGNTSLYGFLGNGYWDGGLGPMAGLNDSKDIDGATDSMTFAFSSPVYGVGGFLNYVPGGSTPATIAVYDAGNNLIESYILSFATSGDPNTGAFYGFLESSAIISSFTLTDNYIGITQLTTVPEPSVLLLLACGGVGLAAFRKLPRKF